MIFKHFNIQFIWRILLLTLFISLSIYLLLIEEYIKAAFSVLLVISIIYELIRYLNRTIKEFDSFLNSMANSDFSATYENSKKGKKFKSLHENYIKISKRFKDLNFERELHFQHLQSLVTHFDIGIISFDSNERIHLINQAFNNLSGNPFIKTKHLISTLDSDLYQVIKKMEQGENRIHKIRYRDVETELSLNATVYILNNERFKLISAKNIQDEMDKKEHESYQKLISVLTHEIMNSVSPILSLTSTLHDKLKSEKTQQAIELDYLDKGLNAIVDRSQNLLNFTHEYRKLTKIPKPVKKTIDSKNLIDKLYRLLEKDLKANNIEFKTEIDYYGEFIYADETLMEQTLINVYKNSIEAFNTSKTNKLIETRIFQTDPGEICIQIEDNGTGIPGKILPNIFVPFYTSKKNGSGIGLSLCKQIVKLHGGKITVLSEPEKFTTINIYLPEK